MSNIHLFAQIAKLIPRTLVNKIAQQHNSDKGSISIGTWEHLLSMVFCL